MERGPNPVGSKALKGLTIKIGGDTTELGKALDTVDKKSRSLSGELGHINRALKLDPTNTELIAQKQQVLAEAITNTEERLDVLKEAEKQVQAQFERGEASQDQVRALRREIIETAAKLERYKRAAKDAAGAGESLGDSADDAADNLDDQSDKADKADKANKELNESSDDLASGGLAALTAAAVAAGAAFVAMVESSRDYRTEMAKLGTAFQDSGHSGETATRTYEELQSVLGETDQAVEAAQQIALLAESEKDTARWAGLAAGLVGRLGNALQPETFYESANETLKLNEATGAYTQLLEQCGESVEKFNEGLAACSTEQEKQEYMLEVTERLLASASREYKSTNAEVIRANQSTEKWNKATAKVGNVLEPVITDVKEFGVALLEDAGGSLEAAAGYIRKDLLPAITKVGNWVKSNTPVIKAGVIGVTAAMVAFKVATIANTIAQKGLKKAIKETTAAQKVLDLIQKVSPWGLVLAGITALTIALAAYALATKKAKEPVDILTKEERELMAAADEAAQAFRDQKKATDEALGDIAAQMEHTKKLAEELTGLADASGKVKEKDQERVRFILNELNEALGKEYKLVDGIIQQYDELESSVHNVIQAKLANSLVEAADADYITAQQEEAAALENATLKWEDYQAQVEIATTAQEKADQAWQTYNEAMKKYPGEVVNGFEYAWQQAQDTAETEAQLLAEKETAYNDAAVVYGEYFTTIANYEEAQAAVLSGNYDLAVEILKKKGGAFGTYSEKVDTETAKVLDTLYKEAVDAGLAARRTRSNFENGMIGYTEEMVKEAEKGYNKAMEKFAGAYADAEDVGEDMTEGMTAGAENKRSGLLAKARSLVAGFLNAAREEADSHSPSRKAIKIFEDIGEGGVIGAERKTKDIARVGTNQATALLNAYKDQEYRVQHTMINVAEQQATWQYTGQMTAATANSGVLGQILQAIKDGQVLLLDGDSVVGGTAGKMDRSLGQLRMLSARGAK